VSRARHRGGSVQGKVHDCSMAVMMTRRRDAKVMLVNERDNENGEMSPMASPIASHIDAHSITSSSHHCPLLIAPVASHHLSSYLPSLPPIASQGLSSLHHPVFAPHYLSVSLIVFHLLFHSQSSHSFSSPLITPSSPCPHPAPLE
jgi:hypothetical protein